MRLITLIGFAILGLALCFLAPENTNAQGKKGGFGGFNQDPGARFDGMSNGRSSIPVNEVKTQNMQMLLQFVQEKNISNGMINRQQYIEYTEYVKSKWAAGGAFNFGGKGNKGAPNVAPGATPDSNPGGGIFKMRKNQGGDPAAAAPPPSADLIKQLAEASFKSLDANGDGKLNQDEMPQRLKGQLAKWDKNGDGLIDFSEYKDYFAAQLSGGAAGGGEDPNAKGVASVIIDVDELDRKVVVFRVDGKVPPGLPAWFKELDKDPKDGQIALNEWRAANKDIDDFKIWDLNDDGFITMEEAAKVNLSVMADKSKTNGTNGDPANFFKNKGGKGGFGKGGKNRSGGSTP